MSKILFYFYKLYADIKEFFIKKNDFKIQKSKMRKEDLVDVIAFDIEVRQKTNNLTSSFYWN